MFIHASIYASIHKSLREIFPMDLFLALSNPWHFHAANRSHQRIPWSRAHGHAGSVSLFVSLSLTLTLADKNDLYNFSPWPKASAYKLSGPDTTRNRRRKKIRLLRWARGFLTVRGEKRSFFLSLSHPRQVGRDSSLFSLLCGPISHGGLQPVEWGWI